MAIGGLNAATPVCGAHALVSLAEPKGLGLIKSRQIFKLGCLPNQDPAQLGKGKMSFSVINSVEPVGVWPAVFSAQFRNDI